jgi:hypothetical protein
MGLFFYFDGFGGFCQVSRQQVLLPEPLQFIECRFAEGSGDAVSGVHFESNERTIRANGTGLSPLPLLGLWTRLQRAQRHGVQPPAVSVVCLVVLVL